MLAEDHLGSILVLVGNLRREDKSLTDELALGIFGNSNGVATGAGCAADESALCRCSPASMADVGELDFAVVRVCG